MIFFKWIDIIIIESNLEHLDKYKKKDLTRRSFNITRIKLIP